MVPAAAPLLVGAASLAAAAGAFAAVGINKSFTPNSVAAGQVSTLSIVLLNPNAAPATGVAVTDTLPAGVVVASPLTIATNTCGFAVGATPGASPIVLTGGTIAGISAGAPGQCQVTINVVSASPSTYLNSIPANAVTSSQGTNAQAAQATLVVSAPANITGSKAFAPANVHGNGATQTSVSTLTITLTNPNPIALTNATITDTLPATVTIATPANAATTCGPGIAAASPPAANPASASLAGGTIPANGSCTLRVNVIARNPLAFVNGNSTNTIPAGALTTTQGATSPQIQANINVQTGAQVVKSFAPNPIPAGGAASTMTFTISNYNQTTLAPITFTDSWAGTMSVAGVPTTTCGGTLTNTANSITLTGGSLGPAPAGPGATSCTITVPVTATATTVNAVPAGNFGGVNYPAASSTLSVSTITGSKSFTIPAVQTGSTTLTITLTNLAIPAAVITTLTDNLTTMGAGFTVPAGAVAGGTCGSSLTSATPGTLITLSGGAIPANGSCTITLPIAIAGTAATGNRTNTIAVNGVVTNRGNNLVTITGTVNVQRALNVTKAFAPTTVQAGARPRLTVTLTRTGGASALTNIAFTDALTTMGAGFVVANPANATTTCTGGTVTAVPGATSFALAGGSLAGGAANTVCTVAVDVATPAGATPGTYTNSIPANAVTTAQGVTNAAVTANLVVSAPTTLTVNKAFVPTTVAVGGTSVMSIQLRNNNASAIALTGVGFTDTLPAGMVVANPPAPTFTGGGCSGAMITAANGSGTVALAGASINANSICTLSVTVRANASGNLINTIPPLAVTSNQGVTNPLLGSATLAATGTVNLNVTKTNGTTTVTPGGTTIYTIAVTNAGPNNVAGLTVNDTPPAGVTFGAWTCAPTGGATCGSGTGPISDTVSIPSGGSLTYTVAATIAASAIGSITNTVTLGVPGSVINTGNTSASDTDTLVPVTSLNVTKTDGSATYTPGGTATYTVVVTNGGPSDAAAVAVNDALPTGATLTGTVTCATTGTASCGTVTGGAGQTSFGTTGATIAAGAGNALTFTVPVAFAASLTTDPLVNTAAATAPGSPPAFGSDSNTLLAQANLAVTKTDGSATYTPGGAATYTVTVTNGGPSNALAVAVTDPLPAGVTLAGTATCVPSGAATCGTVSGTAGQTSFGTTGASIAAGAGNALVFTVPVAFASSLTTDPLVNTVTATDPTSPPASGSDSNARLLQASLAVAKTDGSATYTPGGTATYTVTVTNAGPSDAANVTVADALPAGVTLTADAMCVANGLATCGTVTGMLGQASFGTTGATLGAGSGDSLVFTVPVAFAPNLLTDPLVNTATATDPASPPTSGSDSNTLAAQVTLAVVKTDGSATYTPGGTATYTVTISNGGLSTATNATITDPLPAGVTLTGTVTCVANGTSSCGTVTGTTGQSAFGATGAVIVSGAANTLVFTVPVVFAAGMTAGPLVNTATVTDGPSGATGSGSDSNARTLQVTLAVTKTDGSATYTPGGTATYVVTATNTGASDALDVTVSDTLPAGVTLTGTVTCVAAGGASCGAVTGTAGQTGFGTTGAAIPAGGGNALTFNAPVAFAASLVADPLINAATATDVPSGASGSGSDSNARNAQAGLVISKTDGSATYSPGGTATYTVVVGNNGPSDALDVTVTDPLPAGVTLTAAAVCVPAGNAQCGTVTGTAGQTAFGTTGATVGAGPADTLTFSVLVAFAAGMATDPLVNTVTATDPASPPAVASDSNMLSAMVSLAVTKTDGSPTYTPGGIATYTIVVGNTGVSDAQSVTVADALPAGVTLTANATCVATGNASCGTVTGSAGQTTFGTNGAHIGAGAGNTLTFQAPVAFAGSLTTNPLVNTVNVVDGPSGATGSASDSNTPVIVLGLAVTKTDGQATYVPNGTATYTIVVTNAGPSPAGNLAVADTLPAGAGSSLTFTAPVRFAATLTTDPLVNTVTVSDPAAPSVSASDSNVRAAAAALTIVKTGPASVLANATITYQLRISNAGPSAADGTMFTDPVPAALRVVGANCGAPVGGASCGAVSVAGNLVSGTVAALPPGGAVVVTIDVVAPVVGVVVNTATIAPPPGTGNTNPGGASSTTTMQVGAPATAVDIPVDARWALALLVLALAGLGTYQLSRSAARARDSRNRM